MFYQEAISAFIVSDLFGGAVSGIRGPGHEQSHGQLVLLGFGVATFTPAAYQRRSLQRPLREISS